MARGNACGPLTSMVEFLQPERGVGLEIAGRSQFLAKDGLGNTMSCGSSNETQNGRPSDLQNGKHADPLFKVSKP